MKHVILFILTSVAALQASAQTRKLDIYLVRHVRVEMARPAVVGARKAEEMNRAYNSAPIAPFDPATVRSQLGAAPLKIYSSALPRALATADRVFPDEPITAYAVFNEYALSMVRVPLVRLPYGAWTGLARFCWLTRLNRKGENRTLSRRRMQVAAGLLEQLAAEQSPIVLFSHGYLISELRRELKKRGWQTEQNGGNKNLAVSHLSRITDRENPSITAP